MESVKICHFKIFGAENFAFRTFCCFFLHYIHVKKFVCEGISAEYEFKSEKFAMEFVKNCRFKKFWMTIFCTGSLVAIWMFQYTC